MSTEPKGVKPIFNKPVPYMLQQARLFHTHLTEDLADFTAVDSTVDAAFLTAFQTAITAAEDAEDPMQAASQLGVLTENLNALMEQARNSVQELYFFVGKAFPGSRMKLNGYGKDVYVKVRDNHTRMVTLMDKIQENMVADTAQLIAAGYAQTKIDAFGTLFASLKTADNAQENQKDARLGVTDEYYTKMNAVWRIMSQISELSKIVYADDYVKRKMYLLYDPAHSGLSFTVTVPPAPVAVYHRVLEQLLPDTVVKFQIMSGIGDAWACFSLTNGGDCTGSQQMIPDNAEVEFNYLQLSNGSGQYLKLRQDGNIEMRINVLIPGL